MQKILISLIALFTLTACTFRTPQQITSNTRSGVALRETFATAQFNCFGFNITGPGIGPRPPAQACTSIDNMHGRDFGLFSRPFDRTESLQVLVPPGYERTLGVYALEPQDGIVGCGGGATSIGVGPINGYFLGEATVDAIKAAPLSIDVEYNAEPATFTCPYGAQLFAIPTTLNCDFLHGAGGFTDDLSAPSTFPTNLTSLAPFQEITNQTELDKFQPGGLPFTSQCTYAAAGKPHAILLSWHLAPHMRIRFSQATFEWTGRAGQYSLPCSAPPNLNAAAGENVIYAFKYNHGTPIWQNITGATPLASGAATATQVYPDGGTLILADYVDAQDRIWILLVSSVNVSQCSAIQIDEAKLNLIQ